MKKDQQFIKKHILELIMLKVTKIPMQMMKQDLHL